MSTKYKTCEEVPSDVLIHKLNKITFSDNYINKCRYNVINRLLEVEKELAWFKMVYGNSEPTISSDDLKELNKPESKQSIINRLTIEANNGIQCDVSAIDAVRFRMDAYSLNQSEFAKIIGLGVSQMSEFLSGKRNLPKNPL